MIRFAKFRKEFLILFCATFNSSTLSDPQNNISISEYVFTDSLHQYFVAFSNPIFTTPMDVV